MYSTRNVPAITPTATARPRPTHTRTGGGLPDCTRIDSPNADTSTAVHGVIGGQFAKICVS